MNIEFKPSVRRQEIKAKVQEYDTTLSTLIHSDIDAYHGRKNAFRRTGFWVVTGYRISHSLHKNGVDWLAKILQGLISFLSGCEISRKAVLGPGLRIFHPRDIFVGPHVHIGKKAQLGPHIFLASNLDPFDPDDYPVIDDYFYIAVGAVMLGGITVGANVRIAPNTVVLKDVPDRHNVIPSPCRAVPRDGWKKPSKKPADAEA